MSGDEEALREVVDKINAAARAMTDEDDEDEPPSGAPAPAPTAEAITLSSPSLEGMESPPGQVAMAVPAYPPSPMPRPSELGGGAATEDSPPAGAALVRTGTPRVREGQQVRRHIPPPCRGPFSPRRDPADPAVRACAGRGRCGGGRLALRRRGHEPAAACRG